MDWIQKNTLRIYFNFSPILQPLAIRHFWKVFCTLFLYILGRSQSFGIIFVYEWQSFNHFWFFVIPWTVGRQAPLSMEFSRQDYGSGEPFLSPGDHPNPGTEPGSPSSQALPLSHQGSIFVCNTIFIFIILKVYSKKILVIAIVR